MRTINFKRSSESILKKAVSRYKGYGANYLGRYENDSAQRNAAVQNDSRNRSRWSDWLERINDT